jgi:hypothetical protein
MRHIVQQFIASGKSLGLALGTTRFHVSDRRMQRNLERVVADPAMTAAALAGVIVDHRVVETMVKANTLARTIILELESKLGRKLSRDRAQKLLAAYDRICQARALPSNVIQLPIPERLRLAA